MFQELFYSIHGFRAVGTIAFVGKVGVRRDRCKGTALILISQRRPILLDRFMHWSIWKLCCRFTDTSVAESFLWTSGKAADERFFNHRIVLWRPVLSVSSLRLSAFQQMPFVRTCRVLWTRPLNPRRPSSQRPFGSRTRSSSLFPLDWWRAFVRHQVLHRRTWTMEY